MKSARVFHSPVVVLLLVVLGPMSPAQTQQETARDLSEVQMLSPAVSEAPGIPHPVEEDVSDHAGPAAPAPLPKVRVRHNRIAILAAAVILGGLLITYLVQSKRD